MSNLLDTNAKLPDWPGLEAAMHNVRTHGRATGKEKMIVLNRDGSTRFTYWGDEHQVEMQPGDDLSGSFLVHDHPVAGVELSAMDIAFAQAHRTAGIVATMPDGSWSFAKGMLTRLPLPHEMYFWEVFRTPVHPWQTAIEIGTHAYQSVAPDHNLGARLGNRAILDYLGSRGLLDDYRLHLEPSAVQLFSGLRGLNL